MEKNVTVESSGSRPAPRRRKIPSLRQVLVKCELTEAEAKAEVVGRLHEDRGYWYGILRKYLPEQHVEDAYGQVCVNITERLEQMDARDIGNVKSYISRACVNVAIDKLRSRAAEADALIKVAMLSPDDRVDDPDHLIANERQMVLLGFLRRELTERQSTAYVLRHVKQLKGPEIADALGIPYTLVRQELSKAQKAVNKALDDPEVNKLLRNLLKER
ncbi:sigma-70 family RNA polymerase sigma factor [Streptomyces ossamyceticus]|nr:sigma-70 family RNA polymerase sigma factor [Streptomyces ossamyceticus]